MDEQILEAYRALAGAIVDMAQRDWGKAELALRENPRSKKAQEEMEEVEDFFSSDWFINLSDFSGGSIHETAFEEFREDFLKKHPRKKRRPGRRRRRK